MTFITTNDLVGYLGLISGNENANRLTEIVGFANDWLLEATGRDWVQTSRTDVVKGNGVKTLVLQHYPVAALTSVTIKDGTTTTLTLDVTDPTQVDLVDPENGIIARTDGDVWTKQPYRNVTVVYTGGPPAVPGYLATAALEIAGYLYQTTGGRTGVTTPDGSVTFRDLSSKGFRTLPAVRDALERATDVIAK